MPAAMRRGFRLDKPSRLPGVRWSWARGVIRLYAGSRCDPGVEGVPHEALEPAHGHPEEEAAAADAVGLGVMLVGVHIMAELVHIGELRDVADHIDVGGKMQRCHDLDERVQPPCMRVEAAPENVPFDLVRREAVLGGIELGEGFHEVRCGAGVMSRAPGGTSGLSCHYALIPDR